MLAKFAGPIDHVEFGDADRDAGFRASFAEEIDSCGSTCSDAEMKLALQRIRLPELVLESIIARM